MLRLLKKILLSESKSKPIELSIALVEDDNLFTLALKTLLFNKLSDDTIIPNINTFTKGEDILTHLNNQTPDIIIMDFNLGIDTLDGLELVKSIRDATNNCSLIVLTNLCDVTTAKKCYNTGANNYLYKGEDKLPYVVDDLVDIIRRKVK